MGTILGKGFACSSTSAKGTSAMNCMHECLSKTLFQNYCPHGKIPFSNSACIYNVIMHYTVLLCMAKKKWKKNRQIACLLCGNDILWVHFPMVDYSLLWGNDTLWFHSPIVDINIMQFDGFVVKMTYRIFASTNTCYYSENQGFGGVTIRVLCSKRGCY